MIKHGEIYSIFIDVMQIQTDSSRSKQIKKHD
jgi:hypothetical protein